MCVPLPNNARTWNSTSSCHKSKFTSFAWVQGHTRSRSLDNCSLFQDKRLALLVSAGIPGFKSSCIYQSATASTAAYATGIYAGSKEPSTLHRVRAPNKIQQYVILHRRWTFARSSSGTKCSRNHCDQSVVDGAHRIAHRHRNYPRAFQRRLLEPNSPLIQRFVMLHSSTAG